MDEHWDMVWYKNPSYTAHMFLVSDGKTWLADRNQSPVNAETGVNPMDQGREKYDLSPR
jgi:hypothetical protein